MSYCTCKQPIKSDMGFCWKCRFNIRSNKQIKASKQAKAQLRDSHGRFIKPNAILSAGDVIYYWTDKKQFYNASKKPCREQMDILRNHENRLKQLEKGDSKKRNYQTILIRLDRIEKLLNEINVKL